MEAITPSVKEMVNGKNIERIVSLMETDNSVDAPEDSVKWVKNLYRTKEASRSLIHRIIAVLQMDIGPGTQVVGERSASAGQVRQLLFTAGEAAIDLRITTTRRGASIHGQLLGHELSGISVKLKGERTYATTADVQAEFRIDSIDRGHYSLEVDSAVGVIVVEELEIP